MAETGERYDYVVVGAGSAGAVLAARLSEDAAVRVCLIEAGPRDRHPFIHVPAGLIWLIDHPRLNWRFQTAPQAGAQGRAIKVPRGRTLGGSSAINGMIYMRGHPGDYDEWAEMGNRGWAFADVLPYFKKSENNETFGDNPYHGAGGPLNVTDLQRRNPLVQVFLEATDSLQLPRRADFNAEDQEGFGTRQVTQRNGRRESTATAFLKPARGRPNLTILTGALADRVVLEGGRATGVVLGRGGEARTMGAAREVVLAAGAIGSPALLMRSGIGHGDELARHGIAVAHHLPGVGQNLHDHISAGVQFQSPSSLTYGISLRVAPRLAWNAMEYLLFRQGLFASNLIEGGGFVRTLPGLTRPDIQYTFLPGHRNPTRTLGLGHGYALTTILLRPKSRGRLTLASSAPDAMPVIDPRFFDDPDDMETLLRGVKFGRTILDAPAFAPFRGRELKPGADIQTDDALRDYIREFAATIFHPVGTCRMGADADAVVDPELRVDGIAGLRVADASIMPTIVGGNTNAPVIMIAEKAADMILNR